MSESMNVPTGLAMPFGMMLGFLNKHLSNVPEEKLRAELEKNVHMMAGWLEGPKHHYADE